jgi:hypothetical protein
MLSHGRQWLQTCAPVHTMSFECCGGERVACFVGENEVSLICKDRLTCSLK